MTETKRRAVGILVFDDVEVLDFCGPFEVFAMAQQGDGGGDASRLFDVITLAEEQRTIVCRGGLLVQPHATLADHPKLDILVVPGGMGTRRQRQNPVVLDWIADQARQAELTTSVCTGSFLLAERGLLDQRRATTHWASIDFMRQNYPAVQMVADVRVVDEGQVITSAGVSAGIDMALHVVERLHGREVAAWTARRMEYDWRA